MLYTYGRKFKGYVHGDTSLPVLTSPGAPTITSAFLQNLHLCVHSRRSPTLTHTQMGAYNTHYPAPFFFFTYQRLEVHPICTYRAAAVQSPAGHLGGSQSFASVRCGASRFLLPCARLAPPPTSITPPHGYRLPSIQSLSCP